MIRVAMALVVAAAFPLMSLAAQSAAENQTHTVDVMSLAVKKGQKDLDMSLWQWGSEKDETIIGLACRPNEKQEGTVFRIIPLDTRVTDDSGKTLEVGSARAEKGKAFHGIGIECSDVPSPNSKSIHVTGKFEVKTGFGKQVITLPPVKAKGEKLQLGTLPFEVTNYTAENGEVDFTIQSESDTRMIVKFRALDAQDNEIESRSEMEGSMRMEMLGKVKVSYDRYITIMSPADKIAKLEFTIFERQTSTELSFDKTIGLGL